MTILSIHKQNVLVLYSKCCQVQWSSNRSFLKGNIIDLEKEIESIIEMGERDEVYHREIDQRQAQLDNLTYSLTLASPGGIHYPEYQTVNKVLKKALNIGKK